MDITRKNINEIKNKIINEYLSKDIINEEKNIIEEEANKLKDSFIITIEGEDEIYE